MIVAGWADGYRNNSFRTVEALRRRRGAAPAARRPLGARRPGDGLPRTRGSTSTVEMVAWWDRWLRGRRRERATPGRDRRVRADLDPAGAGPGPARGPLGHATTGPRRPRPGGRAPLAGPRTLAVEPDVGTAAWIDCAGHLPWGLSVDQREDDARSLSWEWAAPSGACCSASRVSGSGSAPTPRPRRCRSSSATSSPTAPRRWSRGAASTSPTATACTRPPSPRRWCPGGSTTWRSCSTPAPTSSPPASGCGCRWPARTGRTRSLRRPRSR